MPLTYLISVCVCLSVILTACLDLLYSPFKQDDQKQASFYLIWFIFVVVRLNTTISSDEMMWTAKLWIEKQVNCNVQMKDWLSTELGERRIRNDDGGEIMYEKDLTSISLYIPTQPPTTHPLWICLYNQ